MGKDDDAAAAVLGDTETRYVVMTLDDAKRAVATLPEGDPVRERMAGETGADMADIVRQLRDMPLCAACRIEAQESGCNVLDAQKLGRRLRRLLERARGLR